MERFLRNIIPVFLLFGLQPLAAQQFVTTASLQLSTPQITIDSVLFFKEATITGRPALPNAKIYVSQNGEKEPLVETLKVYDSAELTFWAEHPDFKPSAKLTISVVKVLGGLEKAKIELSPEPNASYQAKGWSSLVDLQKGSTNFRNEKKWLGFETDSVLVTINLPKPVKISGIQIGLFKDHGSWIFLPAKLEVFSKDKQLLGSTDLSTPLDFEKSISTFASIAIPENSYQFLQLKITTLGTIPDWHSGKGKTPWLFIDEILIEP